MATNMVKTDIDDHYLGHVENLNTGLRMSCMNLASRLVNVCTYCNAIVVDVAFFELQMK